MSAFSITIHVEERVEQVERKHSVFVTSDGTRYDKRDDAVLHELLIAAEGIVENLPILQAKVETWYFVQNHEEARAVWLFESGKDPGAGRVLEGCPAWMTMEDCVDGLPISLTQANLTKMLEMFNDES